MLRWAKLSAQTHTSCNPLDTTCPTDAALGKAIFYDFTKGSSPDWSLSTNAFPTFDSAGAEFTIARKLDSPTMTSNFYIMFGHYDVVLKAAPGVGVISSLVLQSDDLDEIDFEWLGAEPSHVQSNYFGKGNTIVYDRGGNHNNPGNQDSFHTYSVDWTADHITWSIDGSVVRTLSPQTADYNQYPQTPMRMKIGTWPSGDPSEPAGVQQWGEGPIDYSKGPFTMTLKSAKIIDYSTGTSYAYSDHSGSWQSIKSNNGNINPAGNANTPASTASMSVSSSMRPTATPTPVHSSTFGAPVKPTTSIIANKAGASSFTAIMKPTTSAASTSVSLSVNSASASSPSMKPTVNTSRSINAPTTTFTSGATVSSHTNHANPSGSGSAPKLSISSHASGFSTVVKSTTATGTFAATSSRPIASSVSGANSHATSNPQPSIIPPRRGGGSSSDISSSSHTSSPSATKPSSSSSSSSAPRASGATTSGGSNKSGANSSSTRVPTALEYDIADLLKTAPRVAHVLQETVDWIAQKLG